MNTFKQLKIIFYALAAGQIIYFFVAFFLVQAELVIVDKNFDTTLGFVVPIIVVILVISSKLLYKRLVRTKLKGTSLDEKIFSYRTNSISKFVLLEAANLLSVTFFLFTGDFLYLGMFLIVIGLFLINMPGKEKFITDYEITGSEATKLNK